MGNKQPKLSAKEMARQNKRVVSKAVRRIEREQTKLQNDEKKVLAEIKKLATKNQHVSILSSNLTCIGSGQDYVQESGDDQEAD